MNEIEIWFKIYFSSCANRYHPTPFTEVRDFLKQRVAENSRFLETFSIQYSKFTTSVSQIHYVLMHVYCYGISKNVFNYLEIAAYIPVILINEIFSSCNYY